MWNEIKNLLNTGYVDGRTEGGGEMSSRREGTALSSQNDASVIISVSFHNDTEQAFPIHHGGTANEGQEMLMMSF